MPAGRAPEQHRTNVPFTAAYLGLHPHCPAESRRVIVVHG